MALCNHQLNGKKSKEAGQEPAYITGKLCKVCFDMKEIKARRYPFWIWVKLNFLQRYARKGSISMAKPR